MYLEINLPNNLHHKNLTDGETGRQVGKTSRNPGRQSVKQVEAGRQTEAAAAIGEKESRQTGIQVDDQSTTQPGREAGRQIEGEQINSNPGIDNHSSREQVEEQTDE